jgi:zinc/manganese transport system permease protein
MDPGFRRDDGVEMNGFVGFFLMQVSLIAVVLILHTYIGLHIIRRGIIFCDLVLDQLAAFGVAAGVGMGILYGTPASYGISALAVLVGCLLLATIKSKNHLIPQEAIIGIMYGMALIASLLLADKLSDGGTYFRKTLVGSMLWVSWPLVGVTTGVYALLFIFHYVFRKNIKKLADPKSQMKNRVTWDFLFFLTQGIITILIVPVAGVLLAYGFLMIPAAIGALFSKGWRNGTIIGWTTGMSACLIGLLLSYKYDAPYGPSLVISMSAFFLAALLIRGLMRNRSAAQNGACT